MRGGKREEEVGNERRRSFKPSPFQVVHVLLARNHSPSYVPASLRACSMFPSWSPDFGSSVPLLPEGLSLVGGGLPDGGRESSTGREEEMAPAKIQM